MTELSSRQISEAGRLLVQYQLAKHGIAAQPANAGAGFHLALQTTRGPETVRVYTNRAPKPAGGKGRPALAWTLDGRGSSDWIAVGDLSTERVWLFRTDEAFKAAQQHPGGGGHHLVMVTDHGLTESKHDRILDSDFDAFALGRRVDELR
jgi:hypothetical protein